MESGEFLENFIKWLENHPLNDEKALNLVDTLDDQLSRKKTIPAELREHSCMPLEKISGQDDIELASGGFIHLWKGYHNGNPVCIKVIPRLERDNLPKHLFGEIAILRHLNNLNVLPVMDFSFKPFGLCFVSEWMNHGNILDFTKNHPESNRLRLLAEAARGLRYLHSMNIIHSNIKPTNILIDGKSRPRLTDYGLVKMISDPDVVDPGITTSPSTGSVRYMAPELLNPRWCGVENSSPTKESDMYAFGITTYHVLTGQQPFPGKEDSVIRERVTYARDRPKLEETKLSDDVQNFIYLCWDHHRDNRPNAFSATRALVEAADSIGSRPPEGGAPIGRESAGRQQDVTHIRRSSRLNRLVEMVLTLFRNEDPPVI